MDRLSGWLLFLCVFIRCSYCDTVLTSGTCKDGVCTGFSQGIGDEGTSVFRGTSRSIVPDKITVTTVLPPLSPLEALAKALSDQRKYGPEITAQDILDLVGKAVDEKRKRETL